MQNNKNYQIQALLDYAKERRITIDNILRVLTSFNDRYYIQDKACIIPIIDTGINDSCEQRLLYLVSKELTKSKCIAIRDLAIFNELPEINVHWTEWLVYSVLKKKDMPSIRVVVTSNRFKDAIPVVAMIGEDTQENINRIRAKYAGDSMTTIDSHIDGLDDLDSLLEDIIDFDSLEWDV